MSEEIKRYRFKGAAGEYVYANDYDAAQVELAALREELAEIKESLAYRGSLLNRTQLRAEAAERRNAAMNGLLRELRNSAYTKGGISLAAYIDPHIKPTESGASEFIEGSGKRHMSGATGHWYTDGVKDE